MAKLAFGTLVALVGLLLVLDLTSLTKVCYVMWVMLALSSIIISSHYPSEQLKNVPL